MTVTMATAAMSVIGEYKWRLQGPFRHLRGSQKRGKESQGSLREILGAFQEPRQFHKGLKCVSAGPRGYHEVSVAL